MDCVVAPPGVQTLPEVALLVKVTLEPAQKDVGPFAVAVGVGGIGFTVTVIGAEGNETQPKVVSVTV